MWDDLEGQSRQRCGQGLSLRQTKAELDGLLASSVGLRKINEVIHALAHLAPSQQETERTDIPPVVRLDGLWIKMMEATGEEKEDRLGRLRAVKAGVSRPILVAQGVWPAMGRQEILTWLLEEDEGTQSWQNLLDHLYRLGVAADNGLQLLIGDGSPGLQSAWQARLWEVPFQRCIFHKLRNVRRDLIAPPGIKPNRFPLSNGSCSAAQPASGKPLLNTMLIFVCRNCPIPGNMSNLSHWLPYGEILIKPSPSMPCKLRRFASARFGLRKHYARPARSNENFAPTAVDCGRVSCSILIPAGRPSMARSSCVRLLYAMASSLTCIIVTLSDS